MSSKQTSQDDDKDLLDSLKHIWNHKFLIILITTSSLICVNILYNIKEPTYVSKIFYKADNIPPFYKHHKLYSDFEKMFYDRSNFDNWSRIVEKNLLSFDDFSKEMKLNGVTLLQDEEYQQALFKFEKKKGQFIRIKSNDLEILNQFFKYSDYINQILTKKYEIRAKKELSIIETRFKDFSTANDEIMSIILEIDRYIDATKKGSTIMMIERPSLPSHSMPRKTTVLLVTLILSTVASTIIALILGYIREKNYSFRTKF